ncbi:ankyrin repeats (3 copies) [Candidatus Methanoplasma termitum]|uniref:Ankyrin repeats (3 copies) n=1 Tax=Candidatus Methanoplasma termitum TaxID=1577791 RepID=A0A0A7LCB2_9ARCH|nr:ankyrin repeat domain-containing protein [Candidatus Methanoplasma termitum]AIZ56704.1 ankyrin repeats (3 copies) [Candidatus Methanoplasma termitum]
MDQREIKSKYEQNNRDAALESYSKAIETYRGQEDNINKLAVLAADFAHPEALQVLFNAGASPSFIGDYGYTLLHHLAIQNESMYIQKPAGAVAKTTLLLLDNKVSALRKDENRGMTCYHYAAQNGAAEMVEALAERGTKLNMTDKDGNTGIHIACEYVRHAIKDVEYKKKDLESSKKEYEKAVSRQKELGKNEAEIAEYVKKWVTNTPEKAQKNYDVAVQHAEDYFRTVKAFVAGGVDKDEKNSYDRSPLDIAVESDAKKIAAFLSGTLADGGNAAVAAGGMTLHQAAEKGDVEAIKAIAGTGVDMNGLKDEEEHKLGGRTALAIAVAHLKADAVDALLSYGADPSFKDGKGRVALRFLFEPELKTSPNGKTFEEKVIQKIIRSMKAAGFKIDQIVDDDGNTILNTACRSSRGMAYNGRTIKGEVIDEVMKNSPNINLPNRFGETPLMHACARDFEMMENIQLMMLEQGADVSAADKNGDTALHYAARNDDKNGARTLCDMLLEFGADAKAVNNVKQMALDIATQKNNEPLVKLLLNKM